MRIDYASIKPFDDFELEWDGEKFTISATEIMPLLKRVWRHVNYRDLSTGFRDTPWPAFSCAYGEILRCAGVGIQDDVLWVVLNRDPKTLFPLVFDTVSKLFHLTFPPEGVVDNSLTSVPNKKKSRKKRHRKKSAQGNQSRGSRR